jgi:peptide deformylase
MYEQLRIIVWPDPRLKKVSEPVKEFTPQLKALAARMFELMRESKGVGLAAPQVGENIRMFVMNATGNPEDDRVYVNPLLTDAEGDDSAEEGCLSLPDIHVQVNRCKLIRMQAQDLDGNKFEELQSGYIPRIWQHEYDHLNGVLIIDRMGLGDKFKYRRALKDLEAAYAAAHPKPRAKRVGSK